MGWIVLSVPFYEYYGLPSMKTKVLFLTSQDAYCFAAIKSAQTCDALSATGGAPKAMLEFTSIMPYVAWTGGSTTVAVSLFRWIPPLSFHGS